MRLKKIKLAGFKSFVDPTTIPFPGDMTAVVGPNGCGKSNVIDAVRWVLGESSAKNLRGDAMTDVIFNGSSARKPVGQCSVELVFDNSSGRIAGEYASYNELAVKRLVTRDATSTYFLNGIKCRRRDVTDLFLGTGLGPRSYAIIEQGMISRLIESKPQELRVFIEEAAGISRYKERRRETENRIRHTLDNLERLEDVRQELGQQLDKLQRQAAAAQRYKALKQTERRLKSELAAIRWLNHSEHLSRLESDRQAQQKELDALIDRQRGDEAGIAAHRTRRDVCKHELETLQQKLFTTATSITRLEQNALHSKQRSQQITRELSELADRKAGLTESLREARAAYEQAQSQQTSLEPQLAMSEARVEQAQHAREEAEQALRTFNRDSREHEQQYHELKQQVQACHSKIQSTMSMQLRTSQRVSELREERETLNSDQLQEQLAELTARLEEAQHQFEDRETDISHAQKEVHTAERQLESARGQFREADGQLHQVQAKIAALEALQNTHSSAGESIADDISPLWQSLTVKSGFEQLVERVLAAWHHPLVTETHDRAFLTEAADILPQGHPVYYQQLAQSEARPGTLAASIVTGTFPAGFNEIYIAENSAEAVTLLKQLAAHQSVMVKNGPWLSHQYVIHGTAGEQDGALQRAAQLTRLAQDAEQLEERVYETRHRLDEHTASLATATETLNRFKQDRDQVRAAIQGLENQRDVVDMQLTQSNARTEKLLQDLRTQETLLETEQQQLEVLAEQLESLEVAILEHETHVEDVHAQRDALEQEVAHQRRTAEAETQATHAMALKLQQCQSQSALYAEQVTRNESQLTDYSRQEERLREEQAALAQPQETQKAQLQTLLAEKQTLESERAEQQAQLQDIEQWLKEAEQDQQGISRQVQQRQTAIDALNLEIEGGRVRAAAVIEQLEETGQSLKAVLDTLAEDADEQHWQNELEKTSNAISRLGAVNLAAVEEYETQSERKAHLDAQHDDLMQALDTLQSAIRKIDKETRSRFSQTFEQVNDDLKQLFPKVFGGGSAYLALTDDDLLETGVTIMARPPGKKNSTIHLLSGGEKALTALSLVFAIFRLNPAPFCLLDEVDAPLDDANVGRFCKLVSEMSRTVQFIYITHNKIAMEMASHLTGVTMAEPGVSRMVAVDVDEAMAFAEA
ncbi:chromosome segregation protein SMC [Alteromonas sp. ASW11-19]|uniref:Chromosome partition protein Smc n=1 Tax=Alteromonas salexigens TaxID=2982530 RepID=A0ABT2VP96_9ALTE|nr:chromosome segregation protein SMC [Alteromonas salexigens]MCU7554293.1 chromosome segregation protein SMC [Alteromonas salexigens]